LNERQSIIIAAHIAPIMGEEKMKDSDSRTPSREHRHLDQMAKVERVDPRDFGSEGDPQEYLTSTR
jgi:hypothetical protein